LAFARARLSSEFEAVSLKLWVWEKGYTLGFILTGIAARLAERYAFRLRRERRASHARDPCCLRAQDDTEAFNGWTNDPLRSPLLARGSAVRARERKIVFDCNGFGGRKMSASCCRFKWTRRRRFGRHRGL